MESKEISIGHLRGMGRKSAQIVEEIITPDRNIGKPRITSQVLLLRACLTQWQTRTSTKQGWGNKIHIRNPMKEQPIIETRETRIGRITK